MESPLAEEEEEVPISNISQMQDHTSMYYSVYLLNYSCMLFIVENTLPQYPAGDKSPQQGIKWVQSYFACSKFLGVNLSKQINFSFSNCCIFLYSAEQSISQGSSCTKNQGMNIISLGFECDQYNGCMFIVQEFTEDDLKIATNNFSAVRRLGDGGFGTVYRGYMNGTNLAIKKLTEVSE